MNCHNLNCTRNFPFVLHQNISFESCVCPYCSQKTYCSEFCLKEDWINGHSNDCKSMNNSEHKSAFLKEGANISVDKVQNDVYQNISVLKNYEKEQVYGKSNNVLGEGSFGKVFLMRNKISQELCAMKVIEKDKTISKVAQNALKKEIEIHRKLRHENIIKLYECIEGEKRIYIIMEYAQNKTLFHLIKKKKKLSEKESYFYFKQVCNAIKYLHENNLMHRDIKPENLLLSTDGILKLCDFGYCAEIEEGRKTFCGTVEFLAPEIVNNKSYNNKVDIWSMGVLLYEMLHGRPPYQGKRESQIMGEIIKNEIQFDEGLMEDTKEFIRKMMANDPNERPNIFQLICEPWMKRQENDPNNAFVNNYENEEDEKNQSEQIHDLLEEENSSTFSSELRESSSIKNENLNILNEVPKSLLYGFPEFEPNKNKIIKISRAEPIREEKFKNHEISAKKAEKSFWSDLFSFGEEL